MTHMGHCYVEKPQQCDFCDRIDELRPYGPRGECICFDCMMKDEPSAKLRFVEGQGWAKNTVNGNPG